MSKFGERLHFIGIGGISMSSLARFALSRGRKVSGSDVRWSDEMVKLNENGVTVWVGHQPERLEDADCVVYTAAVPETDIELRFARKKGIPTYARSEFLGKIAEEYGMCIAVAGTHGKTTASGILTCVLEESTLPFTAHLGGNLPDIGNFIERGNRIFLTEACEYRKSFLSVHPHLNIVLNVEEDHPDTYPTLKSLYDTFDSYIEGGDPNGYLIINGDCAYKKARNFPYRKVRTYGFSDDCDLKIADFTEWEKGYFACDFIENGYPKLHIRLSVAGKFNLYNAAASVLAGRILGINDETIKRGIEKFGGMERRFQLYGFTHGAKIIHDYAHHPTELKAAMETAKQIAEKRVWTVFQPHTYSRTERLFGEFVSVLKKEKGVYLLKEYPARETPASGKSALQLYLGIRSAGGSAVYYDQMTTLAKNLLQKIGKGDVVLIAGAGDVELLARLLVQPYE